MRWRKGTSLSRNIRRVSRMVPKCQQRNSIYPLPTGKFRIYNRCRSFNIKLINWENTRIWTRKGEDVDTALPRLLFLSMHMDENACQNPKGTQGYTLTAGQIIMHSSLLQIRLSLLHKTKAARCFSLIFHIFGKLCKSLDCFLGTFSHFSTLST